MILLTKLLFLSLFFYSSYIMAAPNCRILYDAGSSGTRLFIYEKTTGLNKWIEHKGPKVEALADPIRQIKGKKWKDMKKTVQSLSLALDTIKNPGKKWKPFDWEKKCKIVSASVLATAGMRMAEQARPERSRKLWNTVKSILSKRLGKKVSIFARTITGFEEGLYAWLSVLQKRNGRHYFGVVEMGGASSQVTFFCANCRGAKQIQIDGGKKVKIFSHSFLGLGGDMAPEILGMGPQCAYGVGLTSPDWNEKKCADTIIFKNFLGIKDPHNFIRGKKKRSVDIPVRNAKGVEWYLTGALYYLGRDMSVPKCCMTKGDCFDSKTSCFKSVYFQKYLDELGVQAKNKAKSSWTLGSTICLENNCLKRAGHLPCRWSKKGCLEVSANPWKY